jgi:stage III sporulation protein AB
MIIKLIGGIMIFSACGIMGIAAANKYSQRPRDIRRLRASIQLLETEVIYGCTPLPQALSNVSEKTEGALKAFYNSVSEDLLTGKSYSLAAAWVKGVDGLMEDTALDSSDRELLDSFGKVLGSSDREDQKKHFELLYIQLKQNEEIAEEAKKKNERMYRSLGFLSGLVIFILLV